jgi:hypothetical protein
MNDFPLPRNEMRAESRCTRQSEAQRRRRSTASITVGLILPLNGAARSESLFVPPPDFRPDMSNYPSIILSLGMSAVLCVWSYDATSSNAASTAVACPATPAFAPIAGAPTLAAQAARADFVSPLLKPSFHWFTTAITSVFMRNVEPNSSRGCNAV